MHEHASRFENKYSKIWLIEIFYIAIMHKYWFCQTHCKDLLQMILKKFISYFLSFISFSMNFRNLNKFLEILIGKRIPEIKNWLTVHGLKLAHGLVAPAWPSGQISRGRPSCAMRRAPTPWSPRTGRWRWRSSRRCCGGLTGVGSPQWSLGRQGKHVGQCHGGGDSPWRWGTDEVWMRVSTVVFSGGESFIVGAGVRWRSL
jgi:hypothetical protein